MTLRAFFVFFKKHCRLILLVAALGALGGGFFSWRFPVSYESSQTVFVKRQTTSPSNQFYTYDGYYSAQAAERFTDSIFGALKSREVLRFLLLKTFPEGTRSKAIDKAIAGIKVKRLSPQLIGFSYRDRRWQDSQRVVENLSQGLSQLSEKLSRSGDEGISLQFINEPPQLRLRGQSLVLDGLVGFLLGGFLSANFILMRDYGRRLNHD